MNKPLLTTAALLLAVVTTLEAQSRFGGRDRDRFRSSTPTTSPSDNPYDVITERNMFLRDRPRPRVVTTRPAPATRPVEVVIPETPEQRYVLRGVAIEDGEYRAYFEHVRTGEGLRVQPGDAIGNGHIAHIDIDAVAYASSEGTITWIDVGENLNGVRDTRSAPPSAGPVSSGAPAASTEPATGPADPALQSLEERMRARARARSGSTGGR